MSEMNNRNLRDYSKYDSMSTEQLQEILRLDAHLNEGEGMDTEELFYVMEVLTVRRKSDPQTAGKSTEEAYREFQEHYMPEEAKPKTKILYPAWLRGATAAAVALVLLMTVTVSANAFGYDLWGKVAMWSKDIFHFVDETQATEGSEPGQDDETEYTSLQDALDKLKIQEKLAPTWLPEGYELSDVTVLESPREISITAKYDNNDKNIRISIRRLIGSKPGDVEKSDGVVSVYDVNGVTYYIYNNFNETKASWVLGEYECFISGLLSIEEIKEIINSI